MGLVGEAGDVPASRQRRPGAGPGCPRSPKPTVEADSPTSAVASVTQTGRLTTFDERLLGIDGRFVGSTSTSEPKYWPSWT